jgi:hypothetical protein
MALEHAVVDDLEHALLLDEAIVDSTRVMPLVAGNSCASMFWIRIVASCVTALAAQ